MLSRRSFLASLTATLALVAGWRPGWAQTTHRARLTCVLTNDIYLMNAQTMADGRERGGFARLAAVVKSEREKARAEGRHVIVAHGGDTLSPSLLSGFDRGDHIIRLTNMVAPDIFVAGNHEFDFGKAVFLERMKDATFPVYGANLRDPNGVPIEGFKDHSLLTIGGVRIGLTGLAYENSARMSSPEDLQFLPTIAVTKAQTELMRKDGADFVIGVLHCDRGDAIALQYARTAELLLTGHTHDLFVNFDGLNAIVESGYDAHYVTMVDLDIVVRERGGERVMSWWPQFRVVDTANVTPDPEVAAVAAAIEAEFSAKMDVPIGTTAVELDSRNATVRTREAAIGNLFADAMRQSMRADAAVINGGGIRSGKVYEPGSVITRRDILAELPFNNRVVVVEMTGRDLREALENGLSMLPLAAGRFPQISGMTLSYDPARPKGDRITDIRVGGSPLSETRQYRVAILDFLARGGDDYTTFRDAVRITPDNDAPLLANEVMAYIEKLGTVRTRVDGRLKPA